MSLDEMISKMHIEHEKAERLECFVQATLEKYSEWPSKYRSKLVEEASKAKELVEIHRSRSQMYAMMIFYQNKVTNIRRPIYFLDWRAMQNGERKECFHLFIDRELSEMIAKL